MFRMGLVLICGVVLGVGLVVAGGDDAPGVDAAVDAAQVCNCPAAEAPLSGRIVTQSATGQLEAMRSGRAAAVCGLGGTVLGGGCDIDGGGDPALALSRSYLEPSAAGWSCEWNNPTGNTRVGRATVICLMPAK